MISFALSTFAGGEAILTIRKYEGDKRIEKKYSTMEDDGTPMLTEASLQRLTQLLNHRPTASTYTGMPSNGHMYIYREYKNRKQLLG